MVNHIFKERTLPPMFFTDEDFQEIDPDHDDPMVITIEIVEYVVMKTLAIKVVRWIYYFGKPFASYNSRKKIWCPSGNK